MKKHLSGDICQPSGEENAHGLLDHAVWTKPTTGNRRDHAGIESSPSNVPWPI
jgi:hypothetical protein